MQPNRIIIATANELYFYEYQSYRQWVYSDRSYIVLTGPKLVCREPGWLSFPSPPPVGGAVETRTKCRGGILRLIKVETTEDAKLMAGGPHWRLRDVSRAHF
jgi:hypothetical protein